MARNEDSSIGPEPVTPDPSYLRLPTVVDSDGVHIAAPDTTVSYPDGAHQEYFVVEDGSYWFAHRNELVSTLVDRFVPPGWFVDVGGGNGFVAHRLQTDGRNTVVVEPGPDGARNSVRRGVRHVVRGTLSDCAFPDSSVDGIGLFDVIEHLEDPVELLRESRRVLQPGGRLILTVPALPWLWSTEDVAAGHFRRYTVRRLQTELSAAGFALEWSSYFFTLLTVPVAAIRALPFRLGRREHSTDANSDHSLPAGPLGAFVGWTLRVEHKRLSKGGHLPAGTSIVAVASPTKC
jgi:SAM-dependent methyltransferase